MEGARNLLIVLVAVTAVLGACSSGTGNGNGDASGGPCGSIRWCNANEVCLRTQTVGGAQQCPGDGGTCPAGYELSAGCCVMTPAFACVPRPSGCGASVTCACAMGTLCTSGHTCTMPRENEIDCTLLAP